MTTEHTDTKPKRHPGSRLPDGTTHWNILHRTSEGETYIVIRFYDTDGNLILEGEY